jgi:hypothetical protein
LNRQTEFIEPQRKSWNIADYSTSLTWADKAKLFSSKSNGRSMVERAAPWLALG